MADTEGSGERALPAPPGQELPLPIRRPFFWQIARSWFEGIIPDAIDLPPGKQIDGAATGPGTGSSRVRERSFWGRDRSAGDETTTRQPPIDGRPTATSCGLRAPPQARLAHARRLW